MFKQSAQHIATYYAQTYPASIPLHPSLQGRYDTEVLIIGAGFSGLHTALRLALAGKRVALLEASRVAWAASGRNGGQALLGWSCDMPPLERPWALNAANACGPACAGRPTKCANCRGAMASTSTTGQAACGPP